MQDEITFERKLGLKGGSKAVTIPIELINYIEAKEDSTIIMQAKKGKHGKYLALWAK